MIAIEKLKAAGCDVTAIDEDKPYLLVLRAPPYSTPTAHAEVVHSIASIAPNCSVIMLPMGWGLEAYEVMLMAASEPIAAE